MSEFKEIRDGHDRLNEAEGGCALWVERAWVQSLLHAGQSARDSRGVKSLFIKQNGLPGITRRQAAVLR
jgi:hypothetical protein